MRAGLQALDCGIPQGWPEYVLHQMVTVMRGGEEVKLSKRAGSYVTLRDLVDEVGRDATRWFLIARKPDSQLTFDIDFARSQSLDNPVYYVQVSHARMCGLLRQLKERGLSYDQANGLAQPLDLDDDAARELVTTLLRYPDVVEMAGRDLEPHQIAVYLLELAQTFQTYYNDHQFLVDDAATRHARLVLAMATEQVLANGLESAGRQRPRGDVSGSKARKVAGKAQQRQQRRPARLGLDGAGHPARGGRDPGRPEVPQVRRRRFLPSAAQPRRAAGARASGDDEGVVSDDAAGDDKAPTRKGDDTAATKKDTDYDFYTLLPGKEVPMSDAELAASERAEARRAQAAQAAARAGEAGGGEGHGDGPAQAGRHRGAARRTRPASSGPAKTPTAGPPRPRRPRAPTAPPRRPSTTARATCSRPARSRPRARPRK